MSTHGCTCWEPGRVEDPDCPRHGIIAIINRAIADENRLASVDEEVDRRTDAAADRADTMIDRYDPDDREPAGGDRYWTEEPTWD